jgi:hypothetical protein
MASAGMNVVTGPGRGIGFPFHRAVFIARDAVVAGTIYLLAEDTDGGTPDDAAVTKPADNSDAGALANAVVVDAATAAGFGVTPAATGKELGVLVLALETQATAGQPFLGCIEGYDVDATVVRSAQLEPRQVLYVNSNGVLQDTTSTNGTTIGTPASARLLRRTAAGAATAIQRVHFCGLPGGFGSGGGTT